MTNLLRGTGIKKPSIFSPQPVWSCFPLPTHGVRGEASGRSGAACASPCPGEVRGTRQEAHYTTLLPGAEEARGAGGAGALWPGV